MPQKLDPIEAARQQLGVGPYAAPAAHPAPPDQQPIRHRMRPYIGADGYTYQRRAHIPMDLWREWSESMMRPIPGGVNELNLKVFWVGMFCGWFPDLTDEDAILMTPAERADVVERYKPSINISEYYAADDEGGLFEDIMQPAASKLKGRVDAGNAGAPATDQQDEA